MTDYVRGSDTALGYRWRADKTAVERLGLPNGRTLADRQVKASIIASLVLHHDRPREAGEPLGRISYSRSRDWYDVPERYRSTPYTRDRVCRAVDGLAEAGLIVNEKAAPGAHLHRDEAKRLQSACYALPAMMDRLKGLKLVDLAPRCPLILRDINGDLVDYADTERTRRLRKDVEETNAWLESVLVTIDPAADPANWLRTEHHLRARKVKADGSETWATTVPGQAPSVVRIFSRSRFDLHGRYYGWWQGLPKDRRGDLLINGEFTVEPDFHWLHPTLLYAMCGHTIAHDPYTTGYWPRQAGKLAFNTFVNAATTNEAIGGLLKKRDEKGDDGEPVWKYGRRQTGRIVEAIREANPRIAHMFGSDAGVRLMNIDSGMAGKVMKGCRKSGIPCLPVHDSFRVPARHEATVTAIMGEVLSATLVGIKSKVPGTSVKTYRHNETSPRAEPLETPKAEPEATLSPVEDTLPAEPVETLCRIGSLCPEGSVATPSPVPGILLAEPWCSLPAEPLGAFSQGCLPCPGGGGSPLSEPWSVPLAEPVALPGAVCPGVPAPLVSPPSELQVRAPSRLSGPFPGLLHGAGGKGRLVRIVEADGRVVKGPAGLFETRAAVLIGLGHDPYAYPVEGKIAPGLMRRKARSRLVSGVPTE